MHSLMRLFQIQLLLSSIGTLFIWFIKITFLNNGVLPISHEYLTFEHTILNLNIILSIFITYIAVFKFKELYKFIYNSDIEYKTYYPHPGLKKIIEDINTMTNIKITDVKTMHKHKGLGIFVLPNKINLKEFTLYIPVEKVNDNCLNKLLYDEVLQLIDQKLVKFLVILTLLAYLFLVMPF